nr:hypothetical protein PB20LOC_04329 [Pectobacterium parmentieri]
MTYQHLYPSHYAPNKLSHLLYSANLSTSHYYHTSLFFLGLISLQPNFLHHLSSQITCQLSRYLFWTQFFQVQHHFCQEGNPLKDTQQAPADQPILMDYVHMPEVYFHQVNLSGPAINTARSLHHSNDAGCSKAPFLHRTTVPDSAVHSTLLRWSHPPDNVGVG